MKIGIITSGGDAPGMNAAIRAITIACQTHHIQCLGFQRGFNGIIDGEFVELHDKDVKHISQLGGTILRTARCQRLFETRYQELAAQRLSALSLDGLIVIGGDGSFAGALSLSQYINLPVIGIPATIDNDIDNCDATLGFLTAVQTATEAIDKIRDTADAHERIFIVEVMGRHSGFIALDVGIATEAERIIYPEQELTQEFAIKNLTQHIEHYVEHMGHSSYIIVMAENSIDGCDAQALAKRLQENLNIDCRALILGHLQRGGAANAQDRILGNKLGNFAVELMKNGVKNKMVSELNGVLIESELAQSIKHQKTLNADLLAVHKNQLI